MSYMIISGYSWLLGKNGSSFLRTIKQNSPPCITNSPSRESQTIVWKNVCLSKANCCTELGSVWKVSHPFWVSSLTLIWLRLSRLQDLFVTNVYRTGISWEDYWVITCPHFAETYSCRAEYQEINMQNSQPTMETSLQATDQSTHNEYPNWAIEFSIPRNVGSQEERSKRQEYLKVLIEFTRLYCTNAQKKSTGKHGGGEDNASECVLAVG